MFRRDFLLGLTTAGATAPLIATRNARAAAGSAVDSIESVARLNSVPENRPATVFVRGYARPADGGEGFFLYDPGATTPPNGGTVFAPDADRPGRWLRAGGGRAVDVRWFGARGDGVADDTAAIQAALDAGACVHFPAGIFRITATLVINDGQHLSGVGPGRWDGVDGVRNTIDAGGTILLATGAGPKVHTVKLVTDCRASGGERVNRNPLNSPRDDVYRLLSFRRDDATPASAASLKTFSCAIKTVLGAAGVRISNLRVVNRYDTGKGPLSGYHPGGAGLGWGDDWDIGLWLDNAKSCIFDNVFVVGYWRMAALFDLLAAEESASELSGAEYNRFYQCQFQGHRGVSIRGADLHPVIGVGTRHIDLPAAATHPWRIDDLGGAIRIGPTQYRLSRYTPLTVAGNGAGNVRLTLAEESAAGGVRVGDLVRIGVSNGLAATQFHNCLFLGPNHFAGCRSVGSTLGAEARESVGGAMEISGSGLRGVWFYNCRWRSSDDIGLFLHSCLDIRIDGEFEAPPLPGDAETREPAMRLIASNETTGRHPVSAATGGLQFGMVNGTRTDFGAEWTAVEARPQRFSGNGDRGLFTPQGFIPGPHFHEQTAQGGQDIRLRPGESGDVGLRLPDGSAAVEITRDRRIRINGRALELNGVEVHAGAGSPEGRISAPSGSLYLRTDGGSGPALYVKTGGGAAGWVAVGG